MSKHAQARIQQRCIPPIMLDLLLQFGASETAGDGASKVFFDKISRRKVLAYAGAIGPILSEHLDVYAVVGADDQVITVGHRLERIRRH